MVEYSDLGAKFQIPYPKENCLSLSNLELGHVWRKVLRKKNSGEFQTLRNKFFLTQLKAELCQALSLRVSKCCYYLPQ